MTPSKAVTPVLFVCLGNICRSPLAEGVFAHLAAQRGMADRFAVDSAGTAGYHVGEGVDRRSRAVAAAHGIRLEGAARQVSAADVDRPGVVVAMDASNLRFLKGLASKRSRAEIVLMRDYDAVEPGAGVPDPYYGGPGGFEEVYEIIERSCRALLDELAKRTGAE